MITIIIINLIITLATFLLFFKYEQKMTYIFFPISAFLNAFILYPIVGVGNFINKTLVVFQLMMMLGHLYLRYKKYVHYQLYIKSPLLLLIIAILYNLSLFAILYTSIQSIYQSSAYLSVTVFIIGIILFQLSETDRPLKLFHMNKQHVYRYFKHPKQVGEICFIVSYMLLTLFMPYFYCYIIIGILYVLYIKKCLLFKEL